MPLLQVASVGSRIYIRELGKEVQYAVIRGKNVLIPSQEIMLVRFFWERINHTLVSHSSTTNYKEA